MKGSRVFRVFFGIILLIIFSFYTYKRVSTSPHTNDFDSEHAFIYSEALANLAKEAELAAQQASMPAETPAPAEEPVEAVSEAPADSPEAVEMLAEMPMPVEERSDLPNIDINSWEFMLVNADHPLPSDYAPPEVVLVSDSQCPLDSRIKDAILAMKADAEAQGLTVFLSSGYRSYSDQAANFVRVCNNNGVPDGKDAQGFYITMPAGCSEHQTGICCDITDHYYEIKNRSIENTAMFQYMVQHCHEFGFILRFPDGKEDITGVMYEPFHFRYVGVEAATYIMSHGLTLEEFVALYQN